MVDEAGMVGVNVGISPRSRASKYRRLLILLPRGLGKEQSFFFFLYFMVRLSHRWQDELAAML